MRDYGLGDGSAFTVVERAPQWPNQAEGDYDVYRSVAPPPLFKADPRRPYRDNISSLSVR